jgi:hypothetical protein
MKGSVKDRGKTSQDILDVYLPMVEGLSQDYSQEVVARTLSNYPEIDPFYKEKGKASLVDLMLSNNDISNLKAVANLHGRKKENQPVESYLNQHYYDKIKQGLGYVTIGEVDQYMAPKVHDESTETAKQKESIELFIKDIDRKVQFCKEIIKDNPFISKKSNKILADFITKHFDNQENILSDYVSQIAKKDDSYKAELSKAMISRSNETLSYDRKNLWQSAKVDLSSLNFYKKRFENLEFLDNQINLMKQNVKADEYAFRRITAKDKTDIKKLYESFSNQDDITSKNFLTLAQKDFHKKYPDLVNGNLIEVKIKEIQNNLITEIANNPKKDSYILIDQFVADANKINLKDMDNQDLIKKDYIHNKIVDKIVDNVDASIKNGSLNNYLNSEPNYSNQAIRDKLYDASIASAKYDSEIFASYLKYEVGQIKREEREEAAKRVNNDKTIIFQSTKEKAIKKELENYETLDAFSAHIFDEVRKIEDNNIKNNALKAISAIPEINNRLGKSEYLEELTKHELEHKKVAGIEEFLLSQELASDLSKAPLLDQETLSLLYKHDKKHALDVLFSNKDAVDHYLKILCDEEKPNLELIRDVYNRKKEFHNIEWKDEKWINSEQSSNFNILMSALGKEQKIEVLDDIAKYSKNFDDLVLNSVENSKYLALSNAIPINQVKKYLKEFEFEEGSPFIRALIDRKNIYHELESIEIGKLAKHYVNYDSISTKEFFKYTLDIACSSNRTDPMSGLKLIYSENPMVMEKMEPIAKAYFKQIEYAEKKPILTFINALFEGKPYFSSEGKKKYLDNLLSVNLSEAYKKIAVPEAGIDRRLFNDQGEFIENARNLTRLNSKQLLEAKARSEKNLKRIVDPLSINTNISEVKVDDKKLSPGPSPTGVDQLGSPSNKKRGRFSF